MTRHAEPTPLRARARMLTTLLSTAAAFATLLGCDEEDACDRYADYICACHEGEPEFDCNALQELALAPSPSTVDQCAIDLANQQSADDEAGLVCDVDAPADTDVTAL